MPRVATTSAYRLEYRRLIADALAALPAGASDRQRRAAVRAASPFNARRSGDGTSWPRKCWYAEVRLALGAKKKPPPSAAVVGFALRPDGWLEVRCDWCGGAGRRAAACLVCGPLWDRLAAAVCDPQWQALRRAGVPLPQLADWLEERGILVPREGLA